MVEEYLAIIKQKKHDLHDFLQEYWNHPHRLAEISLSGSLTMIQDERFYSTGPSALVDTYDYTGSLFSVITRKFYDNEPFKDLSIPPEPAQGEITISQNCLYGLSMFLNYGLSNDDVTVGTFTRESYTRSSISDPWVLAGTESYDITGNFVCYPYGGGDVVSGGRGSDVDTSKATIDFGISTSENLFISTTIGRFPWTDPWPSEVDIFTDFLDDWIANGNATYGGGFSGSCSLSLDFS